MKLAFVLLTGAFSIFIYGLANVPLTLWQWIEVLIVLSVITSFVLPYLLAWIINLFLSKGKRFSLSCEKLSLLRLYAKNLKFSVTLKQFKITGSFKKLAVRTNFKKSFLDITASSPLVLEIDSLAFGIIPQYTPSPRVKSSSTKETSSSLSSIFKSMSKKKDDASLTSKLVSESETKYSRIVRMLIPIIRLLDLHINSLTIAFGDEEFPRRIEVCLNDFSLNGNVQYTPTTSLGVNLKLQTISINNRENEFDSQPNLLVCNFWCHATVDINRRIVFKGVSIDLGDSIHVRIDKSLYRQLNAIKKAINKTKVYKEIEQEDLKTHKVEERKEIEEENEEEEMITREKIIDKLKNMISLLPQSVSISMPSFQFDIPNAIQDEDDKHSNLYFKIGCEFHYNPMFYDIFCSKPKGCTVSLNLTTIESNFFSCDGIECTLECNLRENQPLFESIKLLYNHRATVFTIQPAIFKTADYLLLLKNSMPSSPIPSVPSVPSEAITPKPKKKSASFPVLSLFSDCLVKIDIRFESLTLDIKASQYIQSPLLEFSIQSIACTFMPSTTRSTSDYYALANYEFQFKISSIEICSVNIQKTHLINMIEKAKKKQKEVETIGSCSSKMLSLSNIELNCIISKWEKMSIDASLRSGNAMINYSNVEMMIYVIEILLTNLSEFMIRKQERLRKNSSNSSFQCLSGRSSPKPEDEIKSDSNDTIVFKTMNEKEDEELLLQSILDGSLLPDNLDNILDMQQDEIETVNGPLPEIAEITPTETDEIDKMEEIEETDEKEEIEGKDKVTSEESDEDESDIIFLSETENNINATSVFCRFFPLSITDITVHITNIELQVSGIDSTRSASYSLEALLFTAVSKPFDSLETFTASIAPTQQYNESPSSTYVSHIHNNTVLSPISSNNDLTSSTDTSSTQLGMTSIPLNMDAIPEFTDDSLPSSPKAFHNVLPTPSDYTPGTSKSMHYNHSSIPSSYQHNSGIQYIFTIELTNISIIGDEGTHVPKQQLPVYIPQIRLTLPSLVFLSLPASESNIYSHLCFTVHNVPYLPSSVMGFSGFKRGNDNFVYLISNNQNLNAFQILISHIYVHLSFGSIFSFYHSFVEILSLVKKSTIKDIIAKTKQSNLPQNSVPMYSPRERIKEHVEELPMFSSSSRCITCTINYLTCVFNFTSSHGLMITTEEISAVYPGSSTLPLLYISSLLISQVSDWTVTSAMASINKITLFDSHCYDDVNTLHQLYENDKDIMDLYSNTGEIYNSYTESNKWGDFVFCETCKDCSSVTSECNGYHNHDIKNHVPIGCKPYLLFISPVELYQDTQYTWGDLIYDCTLQWKAFKTLRKGDKKPSAYPSPDLDKVNNVDQHEKLQKDVVAKGIWFRVVIESVCIHLSDVIPVYSNDVCEYSRLIISGVDGVLTYNPILHSRSHFLRFIKEMDEVPTPFDKGFDDVLGLHLHNVFISSIATDFGEQLPPLAIADSLFVSGTFVFADLNRVAKYIVYQDVPCYCCSTFDAIPVTISRCSISTKFYQNLVIQAKQIEVNWGMPLNNVRKSFSSSLGALTPRGVSKSPKLCWYDKVRFNLHGPLAIYCSGLFRVNWITNTKRNNDYEAVIIDWTNSEWLFKREGGSVCGFDIFAMSASRFDAFNQLQLSPFLEIVDGIWNVVTKWKNSHAKEHYVELNDDLTDVDKYSFYKSQQIEWEIHLEKFNTRTMNVSFFLRCELIGFLLDFKDYLFLADPDAGVDETAGLMRNSTVFDFDFKLANCGAWIFINDNSIMGINIISKSFDISASIYKLLPKYLETKGYEFDNSKPDYTDLVYSYPIYSVSNWIYPRIYLKLESIILNHLSLPSPTVFPVDQLHYTPFINNDDVSVMLMGRITKIGVLKGVNPTTSGFDEDIANMYNDKIRGINGKMAEKSEGKFAVFTKEMKLIYSLDIRDGLMMIVTELKQIYQDIKEKETEKEKETAIEKEAEKENTVDKPTVVTSPMGSTYTPQPVLRKSSDRQTHALMKPQMSYNRNSADHRDLNAFSNSLTTSFSTSMQPALYRSESTYFTHFNPRDSFRNSITSSIRQSHFDLNRMNNASFYNSRFDSDNRQLMEKLKSVRSINEANDVMRRKRREMFYEEMKKREKNVLNNNEIPLLSYLLKKIKNNGIKTGENVLIYDDEMKTRKDEVKKDEKEDFLYDIMMKDSQIHIASMETGASLLLYLYKGTVIVQNRTIHQRNYYLVTATIQKVDLFLGTQKSFLSPWLPQQTINSLNMPSHHLGFQSSSPVFKRVVRDFSLTLQTRSQNGFIPSKDVLSFNKSDLVNRITVTIDSFRIRMSGSEFYRFLNVVRYTLLSNPTTALMESDDDTNNNEPAKDLSVNTLSAEILKSIEEKVLKTIQTMTDSELLPVLKVKYTLEQVEWTLLSQKKEAIAVAILQGLVGDHTFGFDGKSESKIILNNLKIMNPTTAVDPKWQSPDIIFDPVVIDRDHDKQSNFLEVIAVVSKSMRCEGVPVSIFEHVGINVFPGCFYFILFQLTGTVASQVIKYFFPEEADDEEVEEEESLFTPTSSEKEGMIDSTLALNPLTPGHILSNQDIMLEVSEDETPINSTSEETLSPPSSSKKNRFTNTVSLSPSDEVVSSLKNKKTSYTFNEDANNILKTSCSHVFEITTVSGNCAYCKKKIGNVRNLGYKCQKCGLLVDKKCLQKALGKPKVKKQSGNAKHLVFLQHLRLGSASIVISTQGMAPLNLTNFRINLQHQTYSDKLATWAEVIKQIRRTYTSELLRRTPFLIKGWGVKKMASQAELKEQAKRERTKSECNVDMSDDMKIQLLLGI